MSDQNGPISDHEKEAAYRRPYLSRSKNNRIRFERAASQADTICQMYLSGYSMRQISEKLEMDPRAISIFINSAREVWMERYNKNQAELISEQLAKLDGIEVAAWEGWNKSIQDAMEQVKGFNETKDGVKNHKKTIRKGQAGDSNFLRVALEVADRRCKLLGLYNQDSERKAIDCALVVVNSPDQVRNIYDFAQLNKTVDGHVEIKDDEVQSADAPG